MCMILILAGHPIFLVGFFDFLGLEWQ